MRPVRELVCYSGPRESAGLWEVRDGGEVLASTRDPAAAVAAMRLLGGADDWRRYLREIGCKPGHRVLDALEGRTTAYQTGGDAR